MAHYSRAGLWARTGSGLAASLLLLFFLVVSGVSDSPPADPAAGFAQAGTFQILSPPDRQPNGAWRVTWSSTSGQTYQLQRSANDQLGSGEWVDIATVVASGPTTFVDDNTSALRRFYRVKRLETTTAQAFRSDPGYFVPLDAGGVPAEGAVLAVAESGLLGPFVYRPGGRSVLGLGQGFSIVFPAGARLLSIEGRRWVSFTAAEGRFGAKAPFQLRSPLAVNGASARLIPVDDLTMAELLAAFGRAPEAGLEVMLFGKFALRLTGGTFTADGLRGARVEWIDARSPLPEGANQYPDFVLEIEPDGGLRIPLAGSFGFNDTSGRGARVTVPPTRPLWLELKANGEVALGGRAELAFSPGPQFSVDLLLNDPNYELAISAKGLRLPLFNALAGLLPATPPLPGSADAAALTAATARLRHFGSALTHFNAAVAADTPSAAGETVSRPPSTTARPSSVLDAWGYAALTGPASSGAPLATTLTNASQAAGAMHDIRSLLEYWASLQRLDAAATTGGLQLDNQVQAELREAINDTAVAVIARSKRSEAISSMGNLKETLRALLEIEQLRQQTGFLPATAPGSSADRSLEVQAAIASLVNRFIQTFVAQLGVVSGAFTPPANSRLAGLARPEVHQHLTDLAELLALRQQLGLAADAAVPVAEAAGQLASRLWSLVAVELTAAEAAADGNAFTENLADAVELARLVDTGVVPADPSLAGLPNAGSLESLFGRWTEVLRAELNREAPPPVAGGFVPAIAGGVVAAEHIPHQVALVRGDFNPAGMAAQQFCGGSILNERWILTAGHCLSNSWAELNPAKFAVLVGVTNLNQVTRANYYAIESIVLHPFYQTNLGRWDYDIALVRLARDIEFDVLNQGALRARPISMISAAAGALGQPAPNRQGRISGWGQTVTGGLGSVELLYADVPVIDPAVTDWLAGDLRSRQVLAGDLTGPDQSTTCPGDSGGPLVVDGRQAGIVSFGYCAEPRLPPAFTRVSSFTPWIEAGAGLAPRESLEKMAKVLATFESIVDGASQPLASVAAPYVRLRCDHAEALVADAVVRTNQLSLRELLAALRLGTTFARLRDRMGYDHSRWWEGFSPDPVTGYVQTNLIALAAAVAARVSVDGDWSGTGPVVEVLLAQADRLGSQAGREHDRQTYLRAATLVLDAVRSSSSALYETYLTRVSGESVGGGGGGGGG